MLGDVRKAAALPPAWGCKPREWKHLGFGTTGPWGVNLIKLVLIKKETICQKVFIKVAITVMSLDMMSHSLSLVRARQVGSIPGICQHVIVGHSAIVSKL